MQASFLSMKSIPTPRPFQLCFVLYLRQVCSLVRFADAAESILPGVDAQRGGLPPYFSPSTPPDSSAPGGKPFYYTPGEHYTFPPPGYSIEIWDDDMNNTVNGWIPTRKAQACPTGTTVPNLEANKGCWEPQGPSVAFTGKGTTGKYLEHPVHVEVSAHIGSPNYDPGTSRWWMPYRTPSLSFNYDNDPFESLKQQYRCSEFNPTLPGLDWHAQSGATYPGNPNMKLHYPNTDPSAQKCWSSMINSRLASDKLNVTYEHVKTPDGGIYTNRTSLKITWKEDAMLLDTSVPNPQRIICLTWKGMVGTTLHWQNKETTRCWSVIFNVKPKLSVCYNPENQNGPDINQCGKLSLFKTDIALGNGDGSIIPVAVGQKFKSYIYFEDGNSDLTSNCTSCDSLKISVVSDPGLPNRATVGDTKGPHDVNMAPDAPSREVSLMVNGQQSSASYYQYSREFTFSPDVQSAMKVATENDAVRNGLKYKMCFFASSTTQTFYPPGQITQQSTPVCAYLQVVRPEPILLPVAQLQPDDAVLPMVADLSLGHPDLPFKARVRCPYKWKISTQERKLMVDDHVNSGFRYQTDLLAGFDKNVYKSTTKVDPANPLPKGAMLMHEPGTDYQILSWSPERGMEGKKFSFCLIVTDQHVAEGSLRMCTMIEVQKCEVCGLPSDTLHSIALEYKTDWLQLWGANYGVENPNRLTDYLKLKLGPMYTLNKGERADTLAARFSMTTEGLMEVNPDLSGVRLLEKTHRCA